MPYRRAREPIIPDVLIADVYNPEVKEELSNEEELALAK